LGVRLVNGGPDEIPQAIVKVTVPNIAASSEGVTVTVRSEAMRPSEVADTMTVNIDANRSACLRYVSGSTQFLDSRHGLVRSLPDGVLGSGVAVGPLGLVLSNGTWCSRCVRSASPADRAVPNRAWPRMVVVVVVVVPGHVGNPGELPEPQIATLTGRLSHL
jgi:hypothetical protein